MRVLRDYQQQCYDSIHEVLTYERRALAVLPTGAGKTCIFVRLAADWPDGRVMIVAHRDELISQAAKKLQEETGEMPAIGQGSDNFANESDWGRSQFVVASIGSLHPRRLTAERFNDIGLLVVDECHHAAEGNKSYGRVIDVLQQKNPNLRVLGVTATPDRKDKRKLLFDRYCFKYTLKPAIDAGWLVPIRNKIVVVNGLDFSRVRSGKGDFNEKDLAREMEQAGPLHEIAGVVASETADTKTVVFCASVQQAIDTSGIVNQKLPGKAGWICGDQRLCSKPMRQEILRKFDAGELQVLVNCQCLTEGWDCDSVGVVAIARPTKSTSLYAQMLGRGTRPLTGLVDRFSTAAERRDAIADSAKPCVRVLDFVDQSRRHDLVNVCDPGVLGGRYVSEAVERAKQEIAAKTARGEESDVMAELEAAVLAIEEESRRKALEAAERRRQREARQEENRKRQEEFRRRQEVQRAEEEARRQKTAHLVPDVDYDLVEVDLFDHRVKVGSGVNRPRPAGPPPTDKQARMLLDHGINPMSVTKKQASAIIGKIMAGKIKRKHVSSGRSR